MTAAKLHAIVGGDGFIGSNLSRRLEAHGQTPVVTTRRPPPLDTACVHLDLADTDAVERFDFHGLNGRLFLLAAVTSLRACRESSTASRRLNVEAVSRLAERGAQYGLTPVLLSTDLVFSGQHPRPSAGDRPDPACEYGKQKRDAERRVLDAGGVVVRPGKVMPPPPGPALMREWIDALRRGQPVEAFADLWFAPVSLDSVLSALVEARPGITHVSAATEVSYLEAARHFARQLGADGELVRAAAAADAGIPPEERPRHKALACENPQDPWAVLDASMGLSSR